MSRRYNELIKQTSKEQKWSIKPNKQFSKEETQTDKKYFKMCSASLAIVKTQTKTMMSTHCIQTVYYQKKKQQQQRTKNADKMF